MTGERITARNRANARKSTGPKTGRGKAAAAQNARRHGATSRPDAEAVATWLAVILDTPQLTVDALLRSDERGLRALALAEAEARLAAAERSLAEFERGEAEPDEGILDLRQMKASMLDDLEDMSVTKREIRKTLALCKRIDAMDLHWEGWGGHRHRLFRRYLREARSKRRRAFEAWIALAASGGDPEAAGAWKADLPKRTQLSP